jgi:hypothetical protein
MLAGTPVQMADGSTKPIEKVVQGDRVASKDEATGRILSAPVIQRFSNHADAIVTITLHDPHGVVAETLRATPDHPFLVDGQGWVAAGSLAAGEKVETQSGPDLTVGTVTWQRDTGSTDPNAFHGGTVYNFEVAGTHTYAVGTVDGGVWVHNACGKGPLLLVDENVPPQLAAELEKLGFNAVSAERAFGGQGMQDADMIPLLRDWGAQIITKNMGHFPAELRLLDHIPGNDVGTTGQWLKHLGPILGFGN